MRNARLIGAGGVAVLAILLLVSISGESSSDLGPRLAFEDSDYEAESAVIWAVGDGADGGAKALDLADEIPTDIDRFLYLGDVYPNGAAEDYETNYEPVYGQLKDVTSPVIGNHEWKSRKEGFLSYWADEAPSPTPLYYAFKLAGWELIALNSETGGKPSASDLPWLRSELSETGTCRLAFWHTPRFSAGFHPNEKRLDPYWKLLRGHATLVLNGHDHNAQIFRPIDGITQMIAGAGGHELYPANGDDPRLALLYDTGPAALRIELEPGRARWGLIDAGGETLETGEVPCKPLPPGPS